MKICIVVPTLNTGGAEKFVIDLANELSTRENIEVFLLTLYRHNSKWQLLGAVNNNVHLCSLNKSAGFSPKLFNSLRSFIVKNKIDVCHVNTTAVSYVLYAALTLRKRVAFFSTVHTSAERDSKGIHRLIRKILYKSKICHPILISKNNVSSFYNLYGIKAPVILNGVSAVPNTPNEEVKDFMYSFHGKVFLHVGRLNPIKNQKLLCETFHTLIEEGYDINLVMIGRNSDVDVYNEIKPYFSSRIVYIGEKSNPTEYMKHASALCLTSYMEGVPISILESLSVGTPVISTPVGGCLEVINEKVGFLSDNISLNAYVSVIKQFLGLNPSEEERMRHNALELYLKNYSISKVADSYLKLYKSYGTDSYNIR